MTAYRSIRSRIRDLPGMSLLAGGIRYLKSARLDPSALGASQSNESILIDSLAARLKVPRSFCEFGFDITEFNCSRLVRDHWRGLLMDGNAQRVVAATRVLRKDPQLRVAVKSIFLDLQNLYPQVSGHFGAEPIGVLSIDVDGNDYWFLEALLPLRPALIVVEYNASFGLRPITVPYDPKFDRHVKHPSGWYHGASLAALTSLAQRHDYALLAVADAGGNAFYCSREMLPHGEQPRSPIELYRENILRNEFSHSTAVQQWQSIQNLAYQQV